MGGKSDDAVWIGFSNLHAVNTDVTQKTTYRKGEFTFNNKCNSEELWSLNHLSQYSRLPAGVESSAISKRTNALSYHFAALSGLSLISTRALHGFTRSVSFVFPFFR